MNKFLFMIFAFFLCSGISQTVHAQSAPSISSSDPAVLKLASDLDAESVVITSEEKQLLSLRDKLATDEDRQIFDTRYKDIQRRKDNLQAVQHALSNFRKSDTMPKEAVTAFSNHLTELQLGRTQLGPNATPFYTGATPGTLDSVTQGLRREVASKMQENNLALRSVNAMLASEAPGTTRDYYLERLKILEKRQSDLTAVKSKLDQVADLPDNPNKAAITAQAKESLEKLAAGQKIQPDVAAIQKQLQSEIEANHRAEQAALALRENAKTDAERRAAEEQYRKTQLVKQQLEDAERAFVNSRNYAHTEQGARIVSEIKQQLDQLARDRSVITAAVPGQATPISESDIVSLEDVTGQHRLAGMEKELKRMREENAQLESSIFIDPATGTENPGARDRYEAQTEAWQQKQQEYEQLKKSLQWLASNPDHPEAPRVLADVNKMLAPYEAQAETNDLAALKDAKDLEVSNSFTKSDVGKGPVSSDLGLKPDDVKKDWRRERSARYAEHRKHQRVHRIDNRNKSRRHDNRNNLQPTLPGLMTGH